MNCFCKLLLSVVLGLGLFTTLGTAPVQAGSVKPAATAHYTYYYLYYRSSPHSQWFYLGWTTNYTYVQQAANYVRQRGYEAFIAVRRT